LNSYEDIRESLKTGDIVLFSGKSRISRGIKFFSRSRYSHVGMVIKSDDMDYVGLWESTTLSNIKDIETNTKRKGVQFVALSERLNHYDGEVVIRRLQDVEFSSKEIKELTQLRKELKNRDYEDDELELIKSLYDGFGGLNNEDLSTLFCSELVAEAYQRLGLLPNNIPSNEYTPADFSSKKNLNLLKGSLGAEIEIDV
jgi:hypothetical protein